MKVRQLGSSSRTGDRRLASQAYPRLTCWAGCSLVCRVSRGRLPALCSIVFVDWIRIECFNSLAAAPGCCYNVIFKPGCSRTGRCDTRRPQFVKLATDSCVCPEERRAEPAVSSPACPICLHSVTDVSCNLVPPARFSFIVHPINLWWPRLGSARGEEAAFSGHRDPAPHSSTSGSRHTAVHSILNPRPFTHRLVCSM